MNIYTRELLEREGILLQSRRDGSLDEPGPTGPQALIQDHTPASGPSPARDAEPPAPWNPLWRVLRTPVRDLLPGRPARQRFA